MEQVKLNDAPETTAVTNKSVFPKDVTFPILIARMMQTQRDIEAYERGEMTLAELKALGVKI